MRKLLLFMASVLLSMTAVTVEAAQFGGISDLYIYPSLQYFTWQEFSNGRRLLKEDGLLYGFGGAINLDLVKTEEAGSMTLRGRAELYGGVVNYDGETQPPNSFPVKTDVSYFGMKDELTAGWAIPVGGGRLEPFAGLGYRWWLRDLHDSTTHDAGGNSVPVQGYTEQWETLYTKLGVVLSQPLNDEWRLFAEAGGKYPIFSTNKVDVAGTGTVTLKPESRWSAFAEIGARYKRFRPAFFYEGYRVGQSPSVRISPSTALLQPKSDEDVFGINFAWCFR